jgi:hypothetical protein
MGKDNLDLINRLFAAATMLLDYATESAISGQSRKLRLPACIRHSHQLQDVAVDLTAIANTISAVERLDARGRSIKRKVRNRRN